MRREDLCVVAPMPSIDPQALGRIAGLVMTDHAAAVEQNERRRPADAIAPERAPPWVTRDDRRELRMSSAEELLERLRALVGDRDHVDVVRLPVREHLGDRLLA